MRSSLKIIASLACVPASVKQVASRGAGRTACRTSRLAGPRRQRWSCGALVAVGLVFELSATPSRASSVDLPDAFDPTAAAFGPASVPAKQDVASLYAEVETHKKKKKKKKSDDEFGGEEQEWGDTGVGVHREQAGVDHPYGTEFSGSTTLQFYNATASGASSNTKTIDINGAFLFIVSRLEIGPEVLYQTTTNSTPFGGTTVSETVSSYAVGPLVKFNFANLDHALLVPFVQAGLDYQGNSAKSDNTTAINSTGYVFHPGVGVNMFLTDHVSFQPVLEYHWDKLTPSGSGAVWTTTTGLRVLLGIGTFL